MYNTLTALASTLMAVGCVAQYTAIEPNAGAQQRPNVSITAVEPYSRVEERIGLRQGCVEARENTLLGNFFDISTMICFTRIFDDFYVGTGTRNNEPQLLFGLIYHDSSCVDLIHYKNVELQSFNYGDMPVNFSSFSKEDESKDDKCLEGLLKTAYPALRNEQGEILSEQEMNALSADITRYLIEKLNAAGYR